MISRTSEKDLASLPIISPHILIDLCHAIRDPDAPRTKLVDLLDFFGEVLPAVVDSGATSTYIGPEGHLLTARKGFVRTKTPDRPCIIANGTEIICNESVEFPVKLQAREQTLVARVSEVLPVSLLLALDSLARLQIVVDHVWRVWHFSGEGSHQYAFATVDGPDRVDLTPDETKRLGIFLQEHIPRLKKAPGVTNLIEHRLEVGNSAPIKQRYYPVTPIIMRAMYDEVDRMLAAGVIEMSQSDWSSPVLMVKQGAKYRFCLDLRKVNDVTKKDAYPLPRMDYILDQLRITRYISTIDLSKAFHQIPLAKDSREITAFTIPGKGLFQFQRMPFRLTNAPATFQRLLDRLIGPAMKPHAFAYVDDVIVISETFDEHLKILAEVFDRILSAGLLINPEKCDFCCHEVKVLRLRGQSRRSANQP